MVKWCSAGTCKHHHMLTDSDGKKKFSFFQFPSFEKQPERRAQWARACARVDPITKKPWQPKDTVQYVYICSAHFITGQPSKEPGHPDFIPTKFATLDVDLKLPTADESQKLRRFSNAMCRHGNKLLGKENSPSAKKRKVYTIPVGVQDSSLAASQLITPLSEVSTNLYESPQPSPSSPCGSISQPTSPSVNIACETLAEEVDSLYSHEHITPQRPESPRPSTSSSCRVSPPSLGQLMLFDEISALRAERDAALVERDHARATLNSVRLSSNTVAGNNEKCQYYTGLTWHIFVTTFQFLLGSMTCKGIPSIPHIDQFFYMLVKLKHGMRFEYLADQVGIPQSTLIDHFWKWLDVTFVKLQGLVTWPEREGRFTIIPPAFKVLYPRLTCIIDCFEVFIESPGNLKARAQVWSNYKRHTTMKFLIGCNPLGAICFLSDAWGGRVSNVEIVTQSGFLTKCDHYPGDQILADRGFTMKEEFAGIASIELHTPAFTKGLSQFPAKDLESSRKLSSVRIHIERVIGLMKNRFAILQGTLPIRHIKSLKDEADQAAKSSADKIVRVCAILTNLGGGIVYKE